VAEQEIPDRSEDPVGRLDRDRVLQVFEDHQLGSHRADRHTPQDNPADFVPVPATCNT